MNSSYSGWDLIDKEGIVTEVNTNCITFEGDYAGTPWYAIHDWEILND